MLKELFISYVCLVYYTNTLGLTNGQGQAGGGVNSNGANAGGSADVGGNSVSAEGNVNFNSSIKRVALVLQSVWGSDTDEDMGAATVNRATRDYDVVVKQDISHWWTELMLVSYFKVSQDELNDYINGNFDPSSSPDQLFQDRLCWLISKDRDKTYAPDYFFPTQVLQMIFVGRDTCDFTSGSTLVEKSGVLTLNVDNSPYFELPDDQVWYLLVTVLHYSDIDNPIGAAFLRVGYRVTNLQ